MADSEGTGPAADRVELGLNAGDRRVVLAGFPVAGALVGLLVPYAWRLVDDVSWLPFRGPLEALTSLDSGWQTVLRVTILAAAGLVLALVTLHEDVRLSVGPDDVRVTTGDTSRTIRRDEVAGVRREGKKIVIETATGRRLLDSPVDGAKTRAAQAFRRFGYPWENDE